MQESSASLQISKRTPGISSVPPAAMTSSLTGCREVGQVPETI